MAIEEKVEQEDLMLYEIIRHPVLFGEFYRNVDKPEWDDDEFEYHDYQIDYACDFNQFTSMCAGRAVGKTWVLTDNMLWVLINNLYPTDYIVYTVPNKVHLEPVWNTITRELRSNSFLKNFIEKRRGINSSSHTIKLLNGSELICRIAGTTGTGANVIGLHTPRIYLDESGYFPWATWLELQPTLNTWQEGFKLSISGVPTGLRENNVCYNADEIDDNYSRHRISAHQNPRRTKEDDERDLEKYGGADSEDYIHFVLGRHGSPTFAVFDRRLMEIKPYRIWKIKFSGIDIQTPSEMVNRLALIPSIDSKYDFCFFGIDLGYTEPTAILIMYERSGEIYFHARISLVKVEYPMQEKLIDYLDTKFSPAFIGLDASGVGKSTAQHLMQDNDYLHKSYDKRIVPIEFSGTIHLGEDLDGNEIKVKPKIFGTSTMQEYSNSHKIIYTSNDMEFITELERMTYTKTPSGDISYRTLTPRGGQRGDDHNTAALLVGTLAYYLKTDSRLLSKPRKKLAQSKWVV